MLLKAWCIALRYTYLIFFYQYSGSFPAKKNIKTIYLSSRYLELTFWLASQPPRKPIIGIKFPCLPSQVHYTGIFISNCHTIYMGLSNCCIFFWQMGNKKKRKHHSNVLWIGRSTLVLGFGGYRKYSFNK